MTIVSNTKPEFSEKNLTAQKNQDMNSVQLQEMTIKDELKRK